MPRCPAADPFVAHFFTPVARVLTQQLQGGSSAGTSSPRNQNQCNPLPAAVELLILFLFRPCLDRTLPPRVAERVLTALFCSWRSSATGKEQRRQGNDFRRRKWKKHIVSCPFAWIGLLLLGFCIVWGVRPRPHYHPSPCCNHTIILLQSPISVISPLVFVSCILMLRVNDQHFELPVFACRVPFQPLCLMILRTCPHFCL
jgi:hypothetical protein